MKSQQRPEDQDPEADEALDIIAEIIDARVFIFGDFQVFLAESDDLAEIAVGIKKERFGQLDDADRYRVLAGGQEIDQDGHK